ncbi:MAG: Flp pilus assembly complex ATPase component TadA, partial [Rothia mucilaginosa]|nr:Flp pilus assembly complex ATPase component TadA [Rothia mucilaginosa]
MENTVPNTKMEHLALLEENIRKAMRRRNLDPREDRDAVRALIGECLDEYEQKRTRVSLPDVGERSVVIQRLHDEICGFGVIQPFLDDESVEEIWINSPDEIFIARNGESELTGLHLSPRAINSLLERMLKPSGRRLDLSSPFVDASLPDGSRLHAVIPDITRRHTSINIRKFVVRARRLPDLVRMNSLSAGAASLLHAAV